MDRLYEVIVWRDEYNILEMRIVSVEQKIVEIKEELLKLAA
jgi:deoxyhypusine synthase